MSTTTQDLTAARLMPGLCIVRPNFQTKTAGGLELPDIHDGRQAFGQVLNAGQNPEGFANGDTVIFHRLYALDYETPTDNLLLVRHEDVMAVVE